MASVMLLLIYHQYRRLMTSLKILVALFRCAASVDVLVVLDCDVDIAQLQTTTAHATDLTVASVRPIEVAHEL